MWNTSVSADFRKMCCLRLGSVNVASSSSLLTAMHGFHEFQHGRIDEPRPVAPKTTNTDDNESRVYELVSAMRTHVGTMEAAFALSV